MGKDVPLEVAVMLLSSKMSGSGRIFFGRTFDLVSQRSINYACVVKVRHTPNARAYVAEIYIHIYICIRLLPTPTTPTNFSIA